MAEPVMAAAPAADAASEAPTREHLGNGRTNGAPSFAPDPPPSTGAPFGPPPTAWGYGEPPSPPPPVYQTMVPYPAAQPPATGSRNTGLLVGLVVASIVALAGVAAALLLALGGDGDAPVRADNAAATTPAQTVVTQVIRERRPRRSTGSSSGSNRSHGPVRAAPATPAPVAPTESDAEKRAGAENAVRRHWSLIESGQYSAAYNLLASSATTASQSTWVGEHAEDALEDAELSVSATLTGPTTARVDVLSLRTVANSGCFTWSGSYDVTKSGGSWKIAKANLNRSDC